MNELRRWKDKKRHNTNSLKLKTLMLTFDLGSRHYQAVEHVKAIAVRMHRFTFGVSLGLYLQVTVIIDSDDFSLPLAALPVKNCDVDVAESKESIFSDDNCHFI